MYSISTAMAAELRALGGFTPKNRVLAFDMFGIFGMFRTGLATKWLPVNSVIISDLNTAFGTDIAIAAFEDKVNNAGQKQKETKKKSDQKTTARYSARFAFIITFGIWTNNII